MRTKRFAREIMQDFGSKASFIRQTLRKVERSSFHMRSRKPQIKLSLSIMDSPSLLTLREILRTIILT